MSPTTTTVLQLVLLLVLLRPVDGGLWKRPALDGSRPEFMRVSTAVSAATSITPIIAHVACRCVGAHTPLSSDAEADKHVFENCV